MCKNAMTPARQRIRLPGACGEFLHYAIGLMVRPRKTMRALLADPLRTGFGMAGVFTLSFVYIAGIALAMARNPDIRPTAPPLLTIAPQRYYAYELFFLLPVALVSVIVQAGVTRLVCSARNGRGTFEDLFAILGLGYTLLALVMGVPDLAIGLYGASVTIVWPHVILGIAWYSLLSVLAVKESEKVPWFTACLAGVMGLVGNGAIQFTYIR